MLFATKWFIIDDMTKQARGEVRRLLKIIGEIQGLVGEAKNQYANDRSMSAYEKGQNALDKAFRLCIQATSAYDPVDA